MKTITLNQYEFGVSSEQFLLIASEHSKYSQDIESFCRKTNQILGCSPQPEVIDLPEIIFVGQLRYSSQLIFSLQKHHQILLQRHDRCISLCDEWDINDYLVFYKHFYIRYHWSTTA